jgi:hypothetical protein
MQNKSTLTQPWLPRNLIAVTKDSLTKEDNHLFTDGETEDQTEKPRGRRQTSQGVFIPVWAHPVCMHLSIHSFGRDIWQADQMALFRVCMVTKHLLSPTPLPHPHSET